MLGKFYSNSERTLTELGLRKGSRLAQKNSLLLLVRGSMLYNKVPVGIAKRDVAFNQDIKSLTPDKQTTSEFLYQWFQANQHLLLNMVVGTGIGAGKLDTDDLKSLEVSLPSLPEQQKITFFLTALDDKITLLTKKRALLEQYKEGVMQKVFNQEIRFKDDTRNDYPDWEKKDLGEVMTIGSGRDYKHLSDGVIPVFGSGGLMTKVNDFLYDGESVGIGRKGTIDKPVFLTGKFWTVDTLFYTHTFKKVIPKFIYYIFSKINWYKYNEASGVPSLSKKTIEKIEVNIPSVEEQTKITNFLSTIDDKIGQVAIQIERTTAFKNGLLQQMFV